jgi:hypothetical protein
LNFLANNAVKKIQPYQPFSYSKFGKVQIELLPSPDVVNWMPFDALARNFISKSNLQNLFFLKKKRCANDFFKFGKAWNPSKIYAATQ